MAWVRGSGAVGGTQGEDNAPDIGAAAASRTRGDVGVVPPPADRPHRSVRRALP